MGNSSSNESVLQQYEGNIEIIEPLNLGDDEMEDDEIQEETDDENNESEDEFYDADEFNDQRVKQKYTTPIFVASNFHMPHPCGIKIYQCNVHT